MCGEALIQLALAETGYNQKQLGSRLSVSPTQISKWKKGEHMSTDMESKLRKLAKIGDMQPDFVLWAGSLNAAKKWERLIRFLADHAIQCAETGYNTYPLSEENELLAWDTFHVLRTMGVAIPDAFPANLDLDYETVSEDDEVDDALFDALKGDSFSSAILAMYSALNDVYGFYAAYMAELIDNDDLDLLSTDACNIEPCLLALAACKIDVDRSFAPSFDSFRAKTKRDYEAWIGLVKDKAFQAGVPLRAELMNLVYDTAEALSHEAEAESLGFNAARIHPDIYMNELLVGMRVLHQVLPAILNKLEIYENFELDRSELSLGNIT